MNGRKEIFEGSMSENCPNEKKRVRIRLSTGIEVQRDGKGGSEEM